MLMIGPNRDFQWRHHTPAEGMPGQNSIAKNYLEKQLIMNLPLEALGLAEPNLGLNAVCVDSSTH